MNRKFLAFMLLGSIFCGFLLASFLFLPYVETEEYRYSVGKSEFVESKFIPLDCGQLERESFLNELDVLELSGYKSTYINEAIPADQKAKMHVFSVYSGAPVVQVDRNESENILVLSSHASTLWTIYLEEGSDITRIFTLGNVEEVRVAIRPPKNVFSKLRRVLGGRSALFENGNLDIVKIHPKGQCKEYGYQWTPDHKGDFRSFIHTVRRNTGFIESTFQGHYSLGSEQAPFRIPVDGVVTPKKIFVDKTPISDFLDPIASGDDMLSFVKDLISKGVIPEYLPSRASGSEGRLMKLVKPLTTPLLRAMVDSNGNYQCKVREPMLIEGDGGHNIIKCSRGDQVIYGGGGRDLIDASWGNDIVYGGSGNDVIDVGWGSDIIIFNEGWGADVVKKTCHHSKYNRGATFGSEEYSYKWKFTNFIVFGPNVLPRNLIWDDNKLVNTSTGDTIDFEGMCFNFVHYDQT